MRSIVFFAVLLCILLSAVNTTDLQVGSSVNATLVYMENVKLSAIPFIVRTKNVFYNDNRTLPLAIKGISAIDLNQSAARASVTAGGVGFTFTNIKLKSESGAGLNYQIQIFA